MTAAPMLDTNLCSAGCGGDATLKCGGQRRPGDYYSIYSFVGRTPAARTLQTLTHPYTTPNPIFLGGHSWGSRGGDLSGGFVGNVADLAIFDRTLSGPTCWLDDTLPANTFTSEFLSVEFQAPP
jgi:hypothetical protein